MSTRRHNRGATLIEAVVAIVVLGIAIPPLVTLFTEIGAHTADHTYQGVGLAYAEALMEEIVSKAYEDPEGGNGTAFVAAVNSKSTNLTTSHTVDIPTHSSGDLLVLAFTQTSDNSPATATNTPSGWTQIRDLEAGDASAVRLTVFTKVGDGSESSVAVTTALATGFCGICSAYSDVTGVVDVSGEAQQESGVDMSAPSVTTTEAGTRVIWCYAFNEGKATQSDVITDPGFQGTLRGFEQQGVFNLPWDGLASALTDTSQVAAGVSGACVFSTNDDSDAGCAITLALKATVPASGTAFVGSEKSGTDFLATSHTVSIPNHSSGDLLVLAFSQTSDNTPATATNTPSGWTQIRDLEAGDGAAVRLTVFTKVGDGSESSVAVTTALDTIFVGVCSAYSGASGVVDVSGEAQQESGVDMTAPSVTTTEAGTRVIWCFVFDDRKASAGDVITDPGFQGTLREYQEKRPKLPIDGYSCALSDASQSAVGASGACVFSTNGDSNAGCAITLALRATNPSAGFGPEEGSRAAYDDVDDYDGLSNSPPERLEGTALSEYGGFTRSVTVENVLASDPDPTTPEPDSSTEFKRIRVTVTWTGAGGGEITLTTLRTLL